MKAQEEPAVIDCAGDRMIGVLHRPEEPAGRGVLIVVGGPQYRIGSHRQFLVLARHLAAHGISVLRFDYRGMGDSEGEQRTFEDIDVDIRTALDAFFDLVPDMREAVIWGLCDAASAAMMYASSDRRVTGLIVLNPWMRSEMTLAKTYLRHYYTARLLDREFWKKFFTGGINPVRVIRGLFSTLRDAVGSGAVSGEQARVRQVEIGQTPAIPFTDRMRDGLAGFSGRTLVILSGQDLTAAEFKDEVSRSRIWRELLSRNGVEEIEIAEANHTFSRREWGDTVATRTEQWVSAL